MERNAEVPAHRLLHSEMKRAIFETVVREVAAAAAANSMDKDIALDATRRLKEKAETAALGQGEWNCFVGRYLAASLSYDNSALAFFELLAPKRKTVLVFKS